MSDLKRLSSTEETEPDLICKKIQMNKFRRKKQLEI